MSIPLPPELDASRESQPYDVHVVGLEDQPLRVLSFEAVEHLSAPYSLVVDTACTDLSLDLESVALGNRAAFRLVLPSRQTRNFHGVVTEVTFGGIQSHGGAQYARYRLHIAPRLWLLSQRTNTRIFRDCTAKDVISEILAFYGIPMTWLSMREHARRDYWTQYEETDFELIQRVAAEEGAFYFFEQLPWNLDVLGDVLSQLLADAGIPAPPMGLLRQACELARVPVGEVLVFGTEAESYAAMGTTAEGILAIVRAAIAATENIGGAVASLGDVLEPLIARLDGVDDALQFLPDAGALRKGSVEFITELTTRRSVRSRHAVFRDFDPRRPGAAMGARVTASDSEAPALGGLVDAVAAAAQDLSERATESDDDHIHGRPLELYEHHGHHLFPEWDDCRHEPTRMLAAARRDHRVVTGSSGVRAMMVGHRFRLHGHPVERINRSYAVTSVTHRGHNHTEEAEPVYSNHFECVPSDVAYVPERAPRRTVQTCLTATVVGHGELDTNRYAEVKVKFHWDRTPASTNATCWLRTMQPWTGPSWGAQFLPRVGTEVVVGFDGGDPDKPIILGGVYNAVNPAPFSLPDDQTRSGIRTRSTPGGETGNELSFEDQHGQEQVYLHASRNFDSVISHDRAAHVHHDDAVVVEHDQSVTVVGAQSVEVQGGQTVRVSHRETEIQGDDASITNGRSETSVRGDAVVRVAGSERRQVEGLQLLTCQSDRTVRVAGSLTEIVGSHDSPRGRTIRVEGQNTVSSSARHTVTSDEELVLMCGQSQIRMTSDRIELASPKLVLRSEDASVVIQDGDTRVTGGGLFQAAFDQVLLRSSGAGLGLSSEAAVEGSQVLLNSPAQAQDSIEVETREPTIIELTDQDGHPVAYQEYRIELEDGSILTGVLNEDGRAELDLTQGGIVTFPTVADVEST